MNRIFYIIFIITILSGCSLKNNSKFWPTSEIINQEADIDQKKKPEIVFNEEQVLNKEFNENLKIEIDEIAHSTNTSHYYSNNYRNLNFDGDLQNTTKYKFSKIKNFYQYEPIISFIEKNLIFFENKGSILKFNENSKLIWKKNYYSKSEKKLNPIIQFSNNDKFLIAADNLAKYYMLNIKTGDLIWSKNNLAPFNSQIKIHKDKFFIVDFSNTLRCFSLKDGTELWSVKTQNSLIRSQKKLSIVIVKDKIFFNNSIGDISAVDLNKGELLWQLPTQSSLIYESAFSLKNSDMITDDDTLFFSNNKNQFFSIDIDTGSFNWEAKINSSLRPTLVGNTLFTVSSEGYLVIIDKNSGNILRVTDIFKILKKKNRILIKPTGFIIGSKKIYLSTSNGRLFVINIATGKTVSVLKIDSKKILRPIISNENLFIIKDNAIIKLN